MLNSKSLRRNTKDLAKLIDVQADRLAELVQNLLDMSRIQSGVLTPRCTIVSLADLVQGVVSDVSPTLRNHDVVVDVPADLPPVDIDLVLIARVLTNSSSDRSRRRALRS